jgi:hypothetical protein
MTDTSVYRAPMRSRRDEVDPDATLERARRLGVVGFGDAGWGSGAAADARLERRVARFADAPSGSFVWTRDGDGLYWLGRIAGPYRRDTEEAAVAVDLVHVRPCEWLAEPFTEAAVPAAVVATFARGGRNFQQTHDGRVGHQTEQLWASRQ